VKIKKINKRNFALFIMIFFVSILLLPRASFSADDPRNKECSQRSYKIEAYVTGEKYCVFPNGNKCLLEEFNEGRCGVEFKTENYCVKEGAPVWDKDKCCPGLIAYLKPYHIGQPSCIKISIFERIYNQLKYNPYLWMLGGLILILAVGHLIYRKIKRIYR